MARLQLAVLTAAAVNVMATSYEDPDMGPAAFMWPPDRVFNGSLDTTAPCGSVNSVTTRTNFPLDKGVVALVAQEESYSLTISVSFKNNPTSQSDFTYSLEPVPLSEIDPGHTCLSVPDPPSDFAAGANATIQLKYTADAGQIEKETFYACADITYVAAASLDLSAVPCFNATEDEPASTTSSAPTQAGATTSPSASATTSAATQASSGAGQKKSGATLSKGGIAGAVIGSAVGSLAIVGLGILFYRERQKTRRLERQRDSAGAVGWRADHTGKDSASGGSYRMDSVAT